MRGVGKRRQRAVAKEGKGRGKLSRLKVRYVNVSYASTPIHQAGWGVNGQGVKETEG